MPFFVGLIVFVPDRASAPDQLPPPVAGVTDVSVELVWDPPWDPSRMSEAAKLELNMF